MFVCNVLVLLHKVAKFIRKTYGLMPADLPRNFNMDRLRFFQGSIVRKKSLGGQNFVGSLQFRQVKVLYFVKNRSVRSFNWTEQWMHNCKRPQRRYWWWGGKCQGGGNHESEPYPSLSQFFGAKSRSITLKMVRDVGKRKLLNIQTDRPQCLPQKPEPSMFLKNCLGNDIEWRKT